MCDNCDKQDEGVSTVEFYQVFLEQGIFILETAKQIPDKNTEFLAKKIRLFQSELESLHNIAIVGDAIYEQSCDVPQQIRDENPESYEKMVRYEKLRKEMNSFLEEVV